MKVSPARRQTSRAAGLDRWTGSNSIVGLDTDDAEACEVIRDLAIAAIILFASLIVTGLASVAFLEG